MINLREKILNANDEQAELVTVEQWGVDVLVKSMTGKERATLMNQCLNQKTGVMDMEKLYALLVIHTAYDPSTNEKVFHQNDLELLNNKNGAAMEKIAKVASRLSGMEDGQVDEKVKN
jgi:hypothetical protein